MPNERLIKEKMGDRNEHFDIFISLIKAGKVNSYTVQETLWDVLLQMDEEIYHLKYGHSPDSEMWVELKNKGIVIRKDTANETFEATIVSFDATAVKAAFPRYFLLQPDRNTSHVHLGPNAYLRLDCSNKVKRKRLKRIAEKFGDEAKVILAVKGTNLFKEIEHEL